MTVSAKSGQCTHLDGNHWSCPTVVVATARRWRRGCRSIAPGGAGLRRTVKPALTGKGRTILLGRQVRSAFTPEGSAPNRLPFAPFETNTPHSMRLWMPLCGMCACTCPASPPWQQRGDSPECPALGALEFDPPVTLFVGENGSGKLTVLESIAAGVRTIPVGAPPSSTTIHYRRRDRSPRGSLSSIGVTPRTKMFFTQKTCSVSLAECYEQCGICPTSRRLFDASFLTDPSSRLKPRVDSGPRKKGVTETPTRVPAKIFLTLLASRLLNL